MTWSQFLQILSYTPALAHAELGFNGLHRLGAVPAAANDTLQSLNLDSDALDDWEDICAALRPFTAYTPLPASPLGTPS
jgi:hypothetical protein